MSRTKAPLTTIVLTLVLILTALAPTAQADHEPDLPGPEDVPASAESETSEREDCGATDNGTTCTTTDETRTTVDALTLTIILVDRETETTGHHDDPSENHWTEDRDTLTVHVENDGPANLALALEAGTRSSTHHETTNGSQPRDTQEDGTVTQASAHAGTPVANVDQDEDASVTYREEHAGDAIHRCKLQANGQTLLDVPCPVPLVEAFLAEQVPVPVSP